MPNQTLYLISEASAGLTSITRSGIPGVITLLVSKLEVKMVDTLPKRQLIGLPQKIVDMIRIWKV
jgi:hypothetical protein